MKSVIANILEQTNLSEQEAWWMLEHITQKSKEQLMIAKPSTLSTQKRQTINDWIEQLTQKSMPLTYLLGSVPFLNLNIKVKTPILIPRAETEEWVAKLIQDFKPYKQQIKKILDIGTGSGCIALALAKEFNKAQVVATDINEQALKLAQQNAQLNNIENISFVQSNLFNNLADKTFDLIVSNPPYIDPVNKSSMMPQVTEWEDNKALFAQHQGLEIIENILKQSPSFLNKNSDLPYQLIFEFDHGQQDRIVQLAQKYKCNCSTYKDLFGNYRFAKCKQS